MTVIYKFRLNKKYLWLSVLWSALLPLFAYPVFLFLSRRFVPFLIPFLRVTVLALFLTLFTVAVIRYKTCYITLKNNTLSITWGIFIAREKTLIISSVISAKTVSTPFMKLLDLKFLVLVTEGSTLILPPLSDEEVQLILKHTIGDVT